MAGCLNGCGARGGLLGGLRALLEIPVAPPGNTGLQLARLEVDARDEALEEMDVLHEDDVDRVLWDVLLLLLERSKSISQSSSSSLNSKSGTDSQDKQTSKTRACSP